MDDSRKNASGCFDLTAYYAIKNIDSHFEVSKSLRDYINKKIKFLKNDFYIRPTEKEIKELFSCRSEAAVDRKAIRIIISHWEKGE